MTKGWGEMSAYQGNNPTDPVDQAQGNTDQVLTCQSRMLRVANPCKQW